jgi:mono/diheme cytochrome c family protein
METEAISAKAVPVLTGAAIGILVFAGLNIWFGLPFIPTTGDLASVFHEPPPSAASTIIEPAGPTDPGEQVFQTVCATCHQANAQGLAGTFPPLAGSEWLNGDPETPIRIVLGGLSGPVTVKGAQYNSLMPPPPGLDDDKIAAVLTFVRSHFDNKAAPITKEQVAAVRAALAGHTKPFTADELQAQRPAAAPAATP